MGPIDYTSGFGQVNPFASLLQGVQAGAAFANIEQQQAARQMKMQQEAAQLEQQRMLDQEFSALASNPRPTFQDYQRVAMRLPADRAKAMLDMFNARTTEQQKSELGFAGNVLAALQSGAPDIGLGLIRERAEAARNGGDEQTAKAYDVWTQLVERDPSRAGATIGLLVSQLPGGDKLLENVGRVGTERRAEAQEGRAVLAFEPEQRKRTADAALAEINATNEPARFGAALGLTEAQTAQARAATAAHAAARRASDATRAAAEEQARRISEGVVPPEKRPEAEGKLRGEYRTATAVYQDVRNSFGRVQAAQDTAVGDLSLIFGYMKMLDPGSVVREGEFATAQNAAGVPERVLNVYNRVRSGERLTENQRGAFKKQAKDLFTVAADDERRVRDGISRIARNYGLNTDNIFIDAQPSAPSIPERPAAPPPAGRPSAAPAAPVRGPVVAGTINRTPGQGAAAPATRNVVVDF
jgi:hypothetical protein